jgi:hypothetical protein
MLIAHDLLLAKMDGQTQRCTRYSEYWYVKREPDRLKGNHHNRYPQLVIGQTDNGVGVCRSHRTLKTMIWYRQLRLPAVTNFCYERSYFRNGIDPVLHNNQVMKFLLTSNP